MGISLSIAHGNKHCRIRPSVLQCTKQEVYNVTLINFLNQFFAMIWLVPKATGIEISPIPKGNVDLLQLLGMVPLVLVVVPG